MTERHPGSGISIDTTELARVLDWTPLDFIRELPANVERQREAERLTAPLAPANDLRAMTRTGGGRPLAVFAERLPWDSDFFGFGVARLNTVLPVDGSVDPADDYSEGVKSLLASARARGIRYLFATVDPRHLALLRALGSAGFATIETRAYYHIALEGYEYPERHAVRMATVDDVKPLARTAREMVNPYDRFHADPFFDPAAVDRLMERWVEASIVTGFADATVVPDAPEPTAFCTLKYHEDLWDRWGTRVSQPVFSAVGPAFRGWYRRIISEINYHLKDRGVEHAYLITQVTNGAVIRVWESLGYRFGRCEHVLRVLL